MLTCGCDALSSCAHIMGIKLSLSPVNAALKKKREVKPCNNTVATIQLQTTNIKSSTRKGFLSTMKTTAHRLNVKSSRLTTTQACPVLLHAKAKVKSTNKNFSVSLKIVFQKFVRKMCNNKVFVVPAWIKWVVKFLPKSLLPAIVLHSTRSQCSRQGRRQRKMSGGDKTKKLKLMVIIFVVCGIGDAAY